ncbi:hypothetical protein ACJMK2_007700, partial [Sinanodonta woodiana]
TTVETIGLTDVTTRLGHDQRTLSDSDLSDRLFFLLKRKSQPQTLDVKRSFDLDPNVDVYPGRQLNDGRSIPETNTVEHE